MKREAHLWQQLHLYDQDTAVTLSLCPATNTTSSTLYEFIYRCSFSAYRLYNWTRLLQCVCAHMAAACLHLYNRSEYIQPPLMNVS